MNKLEENAMEAFAITWRRSKAKKCKAIACVGVRVDYRLLPAPDDDVLVNL